LSYTRQRQYSLAILFCDRCHQWHTWQEVQTAEVRTRAKTSTSFYGCISRRSGFNSFRIATSKSILHNVVGTKSCSASLTLSASRDESNTIKLEPAGTIPYDTDAFNCAQYATSVDALINGGCQTWEELRKSLINKYQRDNPGLSKEIAEYRTQLIHGAVSDRSNQHFNMRDKFNHQQWKIVGLYQRTGRRIWLNINDSLEHCNKRFNAMKIACVEVNVEDLPSNITLSIQTHPMTAVHEQLVLHRSLDALIGVHGSHLTQGVLLPDDSIIVELLPWFPPSYDYWNVRVWGEGWTNQKNHPTPMGILWHNTRLNGIGWQLDRDSIPICQNVSNDVMHDFSNSTNPEHRSKNETELQHCMMTLNDSLFRWDVRNFNVELGMIEKFVKTFYPHRNSSLSTEAQTCTDLKRRGEANGFVLYNVWCQEEEGSEIQVRHYYQ